VSADPIRTVMLPASVWRAIWVLYVADLVQAARDDELTDPRRALGVLAVLQRAAIGFMDQDSGVMGFWSETQEELAELGYELTTDHVSDAARLVG